MGEAGGGEVLLIAGIKGLDAIGDEGGGEDGIVGALVGEVGLSDLVQDGGKYFAFVPTKADSGFIAQKLEALGGMGCAQGILQDVRVADGPVKLEQHLIGKDPFVRVGEHGGNHLHRFLVLRSIRVGRIDEDIGIQTIHWSRWRPSGFPRRL